MAETAQENSPVILQQETPELDVYKRQVSVYLNGRLRARFRQQRVQIGELNSTIEDSLLGQGVVKAFAAEDEERKKFAKGNKDFEQIKTLGSVSYTHLDVYKRQRCSCHRLWCGPPKAGPSRTGGAG